MYLKPIGSVIIAVSLCVILNACVVTKSINGLRELNVPLVISDQSPSKTYTDLESGINVIVNSTVRAEDMYNDDNLNIFDRKTWFKYNFTPSVSEFAQEATDSYMQQMRFDLSSSADYTLHIDVNSFKFNWVNPKSAEGLVNLTYKLTNEAGQTIIPSSRITSYDTITDVSNPEKVGQGMGRAFAKALGKMNWNRIAECLTIAKTPAQERNAQVQGTGETALEHTIIRWNIVSRPQGADVYWRIISSTPDVSNTNSNYVGTTPYESTEAFDIKGMTYNNSGNIQIEVSCEKPGYLTQRKRFNLRQAIDQKEISAMFNLIKEDE